MVPLPVRTLGVLLTLFLLVAPAYGEKAQVNAVVFWNQILLQAVVDTRSAPTVTARALAMIQTSAFDAWSAYDAHATSVEQNAPGRRPQNEWTEENKEVAISFAAYRTLSDLFPGETKLLQNAAHERGIDTTDFRVDLGTPIGIGNSAAAAVLADRHHDGANQLGDLHTGAYSDYTGYEPVNTPDAIFSPDHWQPLRVPNSSGELITQSFVTPQWGRVKGFAVANPAEFAPTTRPATFEANQQQYVKQARQILSLSARLTDRQKIMAEYWALSPGSVTPPGRWFEFAQFISARDHHTLDDDVRFFFVLGNTMLDASIVCWSEKDAFDSERPITAIHYLFAGTQVLAWAGPYLGTQLIDGGQWQPYQESTVVTPAFPEFVSGHSTFSAAAAEILMLWTGSVRFGNSYQFMPGSSILEPGAAPATEITLAWPTFQAAADEAGTSRRYGGIHFENGDLAGREAGRLVAYANWMKAQQYINRSLDR